MHTHTPTDVRLKSSARGKIGGLESRGYNWRFLGASRQGVLLEISGPRGYSWTFLGASKGVRLTFF